MSDKTLVASYFRYPSDVTFQEILDTFRYKNRNKTLKKKTERVEEEFNRFLKYNDCETLSKVLRLLAKLAPIVKEDVIGIWLSPNNQVQRFRSFSNIPRGHYDCMHCKSIETCHELLEATFRQPQIACVMCKATKNLQELSCHHYICKICCKNVSFCPADGTPTPKEREVEQKKTAEDNLLAKLSCPKCHKSADFNPANGMMAECEACELIFCSNCLQPFHGYTECMLPNQIAAKPDSKFSDNSNPFLSEYDVDKYNKPQEKSFSKMDEMNHGATARQYELDFYKPEQNWELFTSDDFYEAFKTSDQQLSLRTEPYPWEAVERRESMFIPAPFQSLSFDRWVEDELLEKTINLLISHNGAEESHVLLESYLMNWSMRKTYGESGILSAIEEKKLLQKTTILALINTDLNGHGGHWILGVVNIPAKSIVILDSSRVLSKTFYQKFFFGILHTLHIAHALEDCPFGFLAQEWNLCLSLDCVQQENAFDCGPLAVCNAYSVIKMGTQSDKLPKSYQAREWIYNILLADKVKTASVNDKFGLVEAKRNERSKGMEIAPFKPKGLNVEFKFFKDFKLFTENMSEDL